MIYDYSIYEVTTTEVTTGTQEVYGLTTCKEKAKLQAVKLFAEHYGMINADLRSVEVWESIIVPDSSLEVWESVMMDHSSIEMTATKLLHNAKIDHRIQQKYKILSSDMLRKI